MPRRNPLADFNLLPDVVTGYELPPCFSLVVPVGEDRTNLSDNPSFETNTTNWASDGTGSISRVTEEQFVGAYSLKVTTSVLNPGGASHGNGTNINLVSGETYAVSCRFLCNTAGLPFRIHVDTNAGVFISGRSFISTGFWQWVWFMYAETSSTNRLFRIGTDGKAAQGKTFYIDAMQIEKTSAGKRYPTTYIDGDQTGLTPGEFPLPYYWNGTPHASTSVRGALTRSGGKLVNLKELGLTIAAVVGLGLPTPQNISLPYSQLDGEAFQYPRKQARTFSIAGRLTGRSAQQLDRLFGGLAQQLDSDSSPGREPLLLKYTPMDEEGLQTGPEMDIIATYEGGLEGQRNNLNTEVFTATFKQYFPFMLGHSEGVALTVNTTVANANGIIRRKADGTWQALSTGLSGGVLTAALAIAIHPNGTVYVGGDFTDAGGSGADYAAIYNPLTNTFSVVGASATNFNAPVRAIAVGPDGIVYFGGDFTNANGIANADGIVSYNPTTGTFAALGTGVAAGGIVNALAFDNAGNLYAGGTFTQMGGVANTARIAKWNGSAWSAMGTGANGQVNAIVARGTDIYIGGDFTLAGGVANTVRIARWNGSTWNPLSTGITGGQVWGMAFGTDSNLYVIGGFGTAGPLSLIGITRWNGVTFTTVGSADPFNSTGALLGIAVAPNGEIFLSGQFTTANGISLPDSVAKWEGSTYVPLDADLPGTPGTTSVYTPRIDSGGNLYLGFNATGSATAAGIISVNHSGSCRTYPRIVIKGPSSGSSRIYEIAIPTTGKHIFLNYTILAGETAVLNFDPDNLSFKSDFQGDISPLIMPGSDEADFYLAPGNNTFLFLATGSPTAFASWPQAFSTTSDAVGKT